MSNQAVYEKSNELRKQMLVLCTEAKGAVEIMALLQIPYYQANANLSKLAQLGNLQKIAGVPGTDIRIKYKTINPDYQLIAKGFGENHIFEPTVGVVHRMEDRAELYLDSMRQDTKARNSSRTYVGISDVYTG